MASADAFVINPEAAMKLESFLNDSAYKEAIENSANYNTRLCIERRMRMPFLDSQTGVAQNHSNLFMNSRQRLPGQVEGQIYCYPSKRWRKKRRQYLMNWMQPRRKETENEADLHTISTVENPAAINEDSKDSVLKDEAVKEAWFYDDLDMNELDDFAEPDADSDYDYEESYKRNKRRRSAKTPGRQSTPGAGRGRRKVTPNYDTMGDTDKPFSCERTPRRGRQNLSASGMPNLMPEEPLPPSMMNERRAPPNLTPAEGGGGGGSGSSMGMIKEEGGEAGRANPSPYCDFCLGDAAENKKTGGSEELVSCSDCGRSGHPSCLQFTANMIISVRKYRWQCIECKCCSVCGTSDNDDQLLFCDDCDRGYHMYCLNPPLTTPPEGSWSCTLCNAEFHKK